jgi:hypothetical protein
VSLEYSIRFGGTLTCEGRPADVDNCILLQSVSGLDGRERRLQSEAAAGADGDVFGPATRAGITLTIEAKIVGPTGPGMRAKERALREILEPVDPAATVLVEVLGRSGDPSPGIRAQMRVVAALRAPDKAEDGRVKDATWAMAAERVYWQGPTDLTESVAPVAGNAGLRFGAVMFNVVIPAFAFDIDFGDTVTAGTQVDNDGDAFVWPTLRIYGTSTAPVLENLNTGGKLSFPALTVSAADYLEIRTAPGERAVLLNGVASLYSSLDRSSSTWWGLVPGGNLIRFSDSSHDGTARLDVLYSDGYS